MTQHAEVIDLRLLIESRLVVEPALDRADVRHGQTPNSTGDSALVAGTFFPGNPAGVVYVMPWPNSMW